MIIAPANLADTLEGDGWTFAGNTITAPLTTPTRGRLEPRNLSPARPYRLRLAFTNSAKRSSGATYIRVQGTIYAFPAGSTVAGVWKEFKLDPTRPPLVEFAGELAPGYSRISIRLDIHLDAELDGPERFALLAWAPRPETRSAKLGEARLGSLVLPDLSYVTEYFILGKSRLGRGILRETPSLKWWQDITGPATRITTWRGYHWNGFTGKGEIGTLSARIYNALEPRATGLIRGTPLILIDLTTRRRLFTGTIRKTITTPHKVGTYEVTIEAVDTIGKLSAVQKYQETSDNPRHWVTFIDTLLKDFPYTTAVTPGRKCPALGSLVMDATLTEYLDVVCATAGVTWWATADGTLRFIDQRGETPPELLEFTSGTGNPQGALVHIHDAHAAIDTEQFISTLEATNHTGAKEDGQWQDTTETVRATNDTLAASYGMSRVSIDTCAYSRDQLHALLAERVAEYKPRQIVQSVAITPWKKTAAHRDTQTLELLGTLDLGQTHRVSFRGETTPVTVSGIRYTITPTTITTHIDLY
ncbi:hypothetical protein HMPREF3167_02490 [Trueperella sp. HMSC08B05]|uniref:hypothetical protein n=1 Tax=Trueperella sp. HMSC08B05 TaxID=1581135 RepID=UPI0008A14111|nr:hypothetical protein [Trueperella sp. HMSC08B05]OFS75707.1 hypothetical protein HMPREF3167_02490 [Trueperella sp. HMSC08B05]